VAEVVVVVLFRAKPGRGADAEAAFAEAVPPTHAEEGCVAFAVHRVAGDADRFALIERWESREALDAHLATPHLHGLPGARGRALGRAAAAHRGGGPPPR